MIIYNVTVNVDETIAKEWLSWMQGTHIPDVMNTGIFLKSQINRVIAKDDTGITFAIAYTCPSMKDLHQYQINFATKLQQQHVARYGDKAVAFRTLMEVIQDY
jgi:hypothetical protein